MARKFGSCWLRWYLRNLPRTYGCEDKHVPIIASSNSEILETRCCNVSVIFLRVLRRSRSRPFCLLPVELARDVLLATYPALSALVSILDDILRRENADIYDNDISCCVFLHTLVPFISSSNRERFSVTKTKRRLGLRLCVIRYDIQHKQEIVPDTIVDIFGPVPYKLHLRRKGDLSRDG